MPSKTVAPSYHESFKKNKILENTCLVDKMNECLPQPSSCTEFSPITGLKDSNQ